VNTAFATSWPAPEPSRGARLGWATLLTPLGYVALTGYDALAFRCIRRPLAYPIGVVRQPDGTILAFTNVWCGAEHEEISIDLMRYRAGGPKGVMDFLFTELILWGQAQGYRWLDLGMAPLAGLEEHPLAPAWNRVGSFLFEHAEHFYNFEGLRQYKDKFNPVWEPRYLMYPGGFVLPSILLDCAALAAGGLREIVTK
jgi:phosphatidylglycerol lysyltransferase